MNAKLLGLLAETSIHPGSGRSTGVVDLPVAREAATDYPVIVGSSLKGALRDHARGKWTDGDSSQSSTVNWLFGSPEKDPDSDSEATFGAGALVISDARLLLLPVRSLTGAYKWLTCPHLLERYNRDRARAGLKAFEMPTSPGRGEALTGDNVDNALFLEERQFTVKGAISQNILDAIGGLLRYDFVRARLAKQVAIVSDDDFGWYARYGLNIQARNVLADGTKQSKNLWYEETLPADTLMYSVLAARSSGRKQEDALKTAAGWLVEAGHIQAGGNETVGQGWLSVTLVEQGNQTSEEG